MATLDLNDIRTFVAIAQAGTLTAASALGKSDPVALG